MAKLLRQRPFGFGYGIFLISVLGMCACGAGSTDTPSHENVYETNSVADAAVASGDDMLSEQGHSGTDAATPSENQDFKNQNQQNFDSESPDKEGISEGNETGNETGKPEVGREDAGKRKVENGKETDQKPDLHPYDFTLTFAGDISFAEDSPVMAQYFRKNEELSAVIDPALIEIMNGADVMWINNEFAYSDRGEALAGKLYTFRANPSRVEMLHELGVDVAGLANNHVYDFGKDAMLDTFSTLEDAGIPYVGAGHNLEEASRPLYMTVNGKTIAFVAASRAEKYKMTPQATEDSPGILRCYDTELFLQEIREAAQNSDFCIALVHWGTEYSTDLEDVQLTTGREYLDAGADAIIGGHSHCLQGFEFYDGKPIVYSLGNFWFNGKSLDTMLITLHIYGDDEGSAMDVIITPGLQENCITTMVDGDAARALYDRLEGISIDVRIGDDGVVRPQTAP